MVYFESYTFESFPPPLSSFLPLPLFSLFLPPSGNRALLPMFVSRGQTALAEASESGGGSSLIVYNGAMVDVGSMMQKLDKSEKAREEIEQKLMVQDSKMGRTIHLSPTQS